MSTSSIVVDDHVNGLPGYGRQPNSQNAQAAAHAVAYQNVLIASPPPRSAGVRSPLAGAAPRVKRADARVVGRLRVVPHGAGARVGRRRAHRPTTAARVARRQKPSHSGWPAVPSKRRLVLKSSYRPSAAAVRVRASSSATWASLIGRYV